MTDEELKYRAFADMPKSLRAGAASGMMCQISVEPHTARLLADIIDGRKERLNLDLAKGALEAISKVGSLHEAQKLAIWTLGEMRKEK